jgi:hypothetical protein
MTPSGAAPERQIASDEGSREGDIRQAVCDHGVGQVSAAIRCFGTEKPHAPSRNGRSQNLGRIECAAIILNPGEQSLIPALDLDDATAPIGRGCCPRPKLL